MAQNSNAQSQSSNSGSASNSSGTASGNSGNKTLLYVGIVVVVVIVVGLILLVSSGSSAAIAQNSSLNSTPISLSPAQTQTILGSQVADYNVSDMFSPVAPINITYLASFVTQLVDNVTSAWITTAYGSNSTENASIIYMVFTTTNTSSISSLLGSSITSSFNMSPTVVTPGTYNGLTYTYSLYENSTTSIQVVSGYKGDNAVLVIVQTNPGFTVNETTLVDITANDTPE